MYNNCKAIFEHISF